MNRRDSSAPPDASASFGKEVIRKIFIRIIPAVFILYIVSYINRVNISYAALQMNQELSLGGEAFGFAAGVFFLGYFLFEVPKNMLFPRYGARICLTWILLTWGGMAMLSGFVHSAVQLFIVRFLLGVAEAGFFPGVLYYLTGWFPRRERATSVALFAAAIPASYLLGAPVSTWVMDHVSGFGLAGWRWMIILEGIPAVLGGLFVFFFMVDRPADAAWLTPDQHEWLMEQLRQERSFSEDSGHGGAVRAIANPKVLLLSAIYFVYQTGSLAIGYWMPQIVKGFSSRLSVTEVGLVITIPFAAATIGMVIWSRHSDRTGERRLHSALPLLFSGLALCGTGLTANPVLSMILISAALTGFYAFKAPFWTLPGLFLSRSETAVSIAAINSIGNLGGFAGPYVVGYIKQWSGSATTGLRFLSSLVFLSFLMAYFLKLSKPGEEAQPA